MSFLLAGLDAASIGALGVLIVGVIGATLSPILARSKNRAETESIATKTTLEVNEGLREELKELRLENKRLREGLRERDERVGQLEQRVAGLRKDIDVLEAEIVALGRAEPRTP